MILTLISLAINVKIQLVKKKKMLVPKSLATLTFTIVNRAIKKKLAPSVIDFAMEMILYASIVEL